MEEASPFFYERLEQEMADRLRSIKEEDLLTLVGCLAKEETLFSEKFLQMAIEAVRGRLSTLQLKTIVDLTWAFAKLDHNFEFVGGLLKEVKDFPRLRESLAQLHLKSLAILLWTFSRNY